MTSPSSKESMKVEEIWPFATTLDNSEPIGRIMAKSGIGLTGEVPETSHVGIEVEVERIFSSDALGREFYRDAAGNPIAHFKMWNNVEDGSLRNSGREFVSCPVKGREIEFALRYLFETLSKSDRHKGYEFTPRTSIHIHMNARDMSLKDLQCFLLIYLMMEPVLFNFCGGKRHKSIFCVPVNQTALHQYLGGFFKKRTITSLKELVNNWRKYAGLNLAPLKRYGTIEFRQMVGTDDLKKIFTWITLILTMKECAKESNLRDLKKTVLEINTTSAYVLFMQAVFGQLADKLYYEKLEKHLEQMSTFIKCCFSNDIYSLLEDAEMQKIYSDKNEDFVFRLSKFGRRLSSRASSTIASTWPPVFPDPRVLQRAPRVPINHLGEVWQLGVADTVAIVMNEVQSAVRTIQNLRRV